MFCWLVMLRRLLKLTVECGKYVIICTVKYRREIYFSATFLEKVKAHVKAFALFCNFNCIALKLIIPVHLDANLLLLVSLTIFLAIANAAIKKFIFLIFLFRRSVLLIVKAHLVLFPSSKF